MLCISIYQESRRFALADMLNASRQGDLLELRLDKFSKDPEVGELLDNRPRPVICSCRRPRDGGDWDGTEEERLTLLRNCIVAGADYVELELDVASHVRRYGTTQRVISYTNLEETPDDIAEIYAGAQTKNPDVIKLVTRVRTPEEAWPLVQILARPSVPTVVVGLGPSGTMLTMLARRIGAPWSYAALERGMESYPGQLTVETLRTVYHHQDIAKGTRFIGVIGSSEREQVTIALVNAAMAHLELSLRCLPLEVGNVRLFRKVAEAVKLHGILVDEPNANSLGEMITQYQGAADRVRIVDILGLTHDQWTGFLFLDRAVMAVLGKVLQSPIAGDNAINGRTFLIAGITPLAHAVAQRIVQQGGILIVTDRDRAAAAKVAQELHCRVVQYEALYTTLHDVLILGSDKTLPGMPPGPPLHTGYLRMGMTVVDLTAGLRPSPLLLDAKSRGCHMVHPVEVLLEQVHQQVKLITGKEVPVEVLRPVLEQVFPEEQAEDYSSRGQE